MAVAIVGVMAVIVLGLPGCGPKCEGTVVDPQAGVLQSGAFSVRVSLSKIPSGDWSYYVLQTKVPHEGDRSKLRHWYKAALSLSGETLVGTVEKLDDKVRDAVSLSVVAADQQATAAINAARAKGRSTGEWKEIEGLDGHYLQCARFTVTQQR
jgi:hypothetical protein